MRFSKIKESCKSWFTAVSEVFQGAVGEERFREHAKREAVKFEDLFLLLCFGDIIGLPTPSPYFTLKFLPYVAHELPDFIKRHKFYDSGEMLALWESFM